MAPHSSTLAWKIPWTEDPGGPQSMGSLRVGHDWATSMSLSLSCIGKGNGNPLKYSCLENPRDGGAWWTAVYVVEQSQTRLKRLSSSSSLALFIMYWLFFISPSCLLNISCIFSILVSKLFIHNSILFSRFWIIFTIIILNYLSDRFPISSSLVWWVFILFLYLLSICMPFHIVYIACLGWSFCILAVCGSSLLWKFLVGKVYAWLVKVSWLGKLVSVFWCVELDYFSLECNEVSSSELWDVNGFGVTLGSLYIEAQGYVPVLLENLRGMSCSGSCWTLGDAWFQCRYGGFWWALID